MDYIVFVRVLVWGKLCQFTKLYQNRIIFNERTAQTMLICTKVNLYLNGLISV